MAAPNSRRPRPELVDSFVTGRQLMHETPPRIQKSNFPDSANEHDRFASIENASTRNRLTFLSPAPDA
jgi:hypothetical protein